MDYAIKAVCAMFPDVDEFDVAEGLHWFLSDFHGGQNSPEYRALCALCYHASPMHSGPSTDDAQIVYDALSQIWNRLHRLGVNRA